jgi:hypothetical protein
MHRILPLFVFLLAINPAVAKNAPSRTAPKGCAWEKLSDPTLGLDAWIQHCDYHGRKISLYAKGNALLQHYSDGGEDEKLIEVFDLKNGESPQAAIQRVFAEHTPDQSLVARCQLKPYKDEAPQAKRSPKGVARYTFLPNAALKKELDAKQDPGDIPEPPCGDWGYAPDGIQYFEAHAGANKILFVRVGQDEPMFDEQTLRILPTNPKP